MNPDGEPACIDAVGGSVLLPIMINQTSPKSITLQRTDLRTHETETIDIPSKECRRMRKIADKEHGKKNTTNPTILRYPVRKSGSYRLASVVDQSGLEVQRKTAESLVVDCPRAFIKEISAPKCRGDLSNFHVHVEGTPPLKVKYSKVVNGKRQSHVLLNVNPERLDTNAPTPMSTDAIVTASDGVPDLSWARAHHMDIPLNESLAELGTWTYTIDVIQDSRGNAVQYTAGGDQDPLRLSRGVSIQQSFRVHDHPSAVLDGCDSQVPLKVAAGKSRTLPIWLNPTVRNPTSATDHHVTYAFAPFSDGEYQQGARSPFTKSVTIGPNSQGPVIREPGRYSLVSVSTTFCTGEILEPSSCLLLNPSEPDLSVSHEDIPHKCAGNFVGLKVDLNFIGTPPFEVSYTVTRRNGPTVPQLKRFDSMRAYMELKPGDPGYYTYDFLDIADAVYKKPRALRERIRLEQDVKPTASAAFVSLAPQEQACIGQSMSIPISLSGEFPWTLEYDIIHNERREKYTLENIVDADHILVAPRMMSGGLHTLSLTSVTDASGCRVSLEQEIQIQVRHQMPSATFGAIEGSRVASALQGKTVNLPLRLSGQGPWTVSYSQSSESGNATQEARLQYSNDVLTVASAGVYEILTVRDVVCPGAVDQTASRFEVKRIPRPDMHIAESRTLSKVGARWVKKAICEGDIDTLDVLFTGKPPFSVRYDIDMKSDPGSTPNRLTRKEHMALAGASVNMMTSPAGLYTYHFKELGDQLYDRGNLESPPLSVQQRIEARPSARFEETGKTYSYCKETASGNQGIPIQLTGSPPFSLEIIVKHHPSARSESVNIPQVEATRFKFQIPDRVLSLGSHAISIRKVQDGHGCQKTFGDDGPVTHVSVADVPTISDIEKASDFCVGDRISFNLAGTPPFNIFYVFEGRERKASTSDTLFRRIAEKPGNFTITGVSDKSSFDSCRASTAMTKLIHELPSVRISRGRTTHVDIHEGGSAEILFEFGGTPPFEFT